MGEEQNIFSDNQRNTIYEDMLKPIKLKISEILLYDTETAMQFLQEYNAIIKSKQEKEMLSKISDLELQIDSYERNMGSTKSFEDKSDAILQQIKDMQTDGRKLSLEEYEDEFDRLSKTYKSMVSKYSFEDRDRIEQALYELYGNLMVRRVKEGSVDEVQIPEEDILGLTIYLNGQIDKLSENATPQVKNILERIKFKLMSGKEAFQDDEIWKLLSYAQGNKTMQEQRSSYTQGGKQQVTALTIGKEKKGFLSSLKGIFSKEPKLPLKENDLDKITLEWLAKQIPESMCREYEEERLKKEGKTKKKVYIPDPKFVIVDTLLTRKYDDPYKIKYKNEFIFQDQYGCKQKITQKSDVDPDFIEAPYSVEWKPIDVDKEKQEEMKRKIDMTFDFCMLLKYINIIDSAMQTDFLQIFISQFMPMANKYNNDSVIDYSLIDDFLLSIKHDSVYIFENEMPIFKKLYKGYKRVKDEIEKMELEVRNRDNGNRDEFYKENEFSKNLSRDGKVAKERHAQRQEVDQAKQVGDDSITPTVAEQEEDRG